LLERKKRKFTQINYTCHSWQSQAAKPSGGLDPQSSKKRGDSETSSE